MNPTKEHNPKTNGNDHIAGTETSNDIEVDATANGVLHLAEASDMIAKFSAVVKF